MTEKTSSPPEVNGDYSDVPVWGAEAIGQVIGRTQKQTFHLLETGQIQSAKKKGNKWVALPSALRAEFGAP